MSRFVTFSAFFLLLAGFCGCNETSGERWPDYECLKPYKKETCLKIRSVETNYSEAEGLCILNNAQLVTIDSAEKQRFVEDFLKQEKLDHNIWIGLKYTQNYKTYQWPFEREMTYRNWKYGYPKYDPKYCVELITDRDFFGTWSESLCGEKRHILCETVQKWSFEELQARFTNLVKDKIQLESKIEELEHNKIPAGFIYVQLPSQTSPEDLWPFYNWYDISSNYSGLFFRVKGGNATDFGTVQEQSTRAISDISRVNSTGKHEEVKYTGNYAGCLPPLAVGDFGRGSKALQFCVNWDETRPRNTAVKIWTRL